MMKRFLWLSGIFLFILIPFTNHLFAAKSNVRSADNKKHALLIGVGDYVDAAIDDLEGPPHDIVALQTLLKDSFGFPSNHIIILTDKNATRANILDALKNLNHVTKPGDFIFFYFSGHGTSYYDKALNDLDIEPHSGALIPTDFDSNGSADEMRKKLIIGKRDIRPILEELEKERQVLAVFDACFSGCTIRSVRRNPKVRYHPLPKPEPGFASQVEDLTDEEDEETQAYGTDTIQKAPPYPYQNVVYVSASSKFEVAVDINGQIKTADGKPHGAMTNALILALQGKGDTNNDGKLTYNEIYQYVKHKVSKDFSHTPQILYPQNRKALLDQPIFHKVHAAAPDAPPMSGGQLKVKLEGMSQNLEGKIAGIQGVDVTGRDYDILITKFQDTYRVYLASGVMLANIPQTKPDDLVERIRRQVLVRGLIRLSFPGQRFNVFLDTMERKGVWVEDDLLGFTIRSEADCHILLISIDTEGMVSVIYPYFEEELGRTVKAGQDLRFPELGKVEPPNFGVEYVKVFAFTKQLPALKRFMGATFSPAAPQFSELMRMLGDAADNAAQMTLQLKTCAKKDLVKE